MSEYERHKQISEEVDRTLGFRFDECEAPIRARTTTQENWSHLSPQIFQTPYSELEEIIERVDPGKKSLVWADLGAAYGRLGIVLAAIRPTARFIGIELEPERVQEARRIFLSLNLQQAEIQAANLEEIPLPEADVYFIYDFGTQAAVDRSIEQLRERARTHPIVVIGRGRRIRDTIEGRHPWLGSVVAPEHTAHYSIYRSA